MWSACITALGEAVENAVYHAQSPLETPSLVRIEVTITDNMIQMQVGDQGQGFNLEAYLTKLPESVPSHAEKGRGLWIISQIADYFSYTRTAENLNCLTIQKFWNSKK